MLGVQQKPDLKWCKVLIWEKKSESRGPTLNLVIVDFYLRREGKAKEVPSDQRGV